MTVDPVLIDSFDGKRLNSPNDVVVKSDGSIWFTDPVFGLLGNYEGYKAEPELDMNAYRIDGATGKATIVAEGVLGPNGYRLLARRKNPLCHRIPRRAHPQDPRL